MSNVQQLGKALITPNFPMDLHITELLIFEEASRKLKVKLNIFQRTIKLDTTVEQNPLHAHIVRTASSCTAARSLLKKDLSMLQSRGLEPSGNWRNSSSRMPDFGVLEPSRGRPSN